MIEDAFELDISASLTSAQTASATAFSGLETLTDATFTLDFSGQGGSYPADMMVYIYAPNGNCIVWGGWNVMPMGDCEDEGTGVGNAWPQNWNTTAAGEYTYELDLMSNNLGGSGEWILTIQNGWTGGGTANYELNVLFEGIAIACDCDGNVLDECDVCDGPGAIYECGCFDIREGECDCDGNVLDECGVCGGDGSTCPPGCTDPEACNYDKTATVDDGSCEYESCSGCTDPEACNYDEDATIDDGLCDYSCYGCSDPEACNYDEDATINDGSCLSLIHI